MSNHAALLLFILTTKVGSSWGDREETKKMWPRNCYAATTIHFLAVGYLVHLCGQAMGQMVKPYVWHAWMGGYTVLRLVLYWR